MLNIKITGDRELAFDLARMRSLAQVTVKDVVRRSAHLVEKTVKENLSNKILNVRTGQLRRSITTQFSGTAAAPSAEIGTNLVYAAIHEFGGIIRAKNAPYLWFKLQTGAKIMSKGGGFLKNPKAIYGWVRTKQVTIPARPYMKPAFESSLALIDRIVEEELEKLINV